MKRVTVIDYGVGNLLSVRRAFEHFGAEVILAETAAQLAAADRLVLPGVGAFGDGMAGLRARHLVEAVVQHAAGGRPFLGICLGMQMMLDASEEFGEHAGLGIIPGKVKAISPVGRDGRPHKIPHIGWSALAVPPGHAPWGHGLLHGITPGDAVYFVHSFTAVPTSDAHRLADCDYDGLAISAAIGRDNIYGCQFHPEKSGRVGLRMIANFLEL
jgi:glutamine amidotransferase